jgi:hypothetical protein
MALLHSPLTDAADHLDADALATQPMADINDLYSWMTADGSKINIALTVSPGDPGTRTFGPTVQYVFHLTRHMAFPATAAAIAAGEESRIVCTFASNTEGQCWVLDPAGALLDYVGGDFSATTGKTSAAGKIKVFAGRRSDPFFFNLAGFKNAQATLEGVCGGGTPGACPGVLATGGAIDAAGCPNNATATIGLAGQIRPMLSATPATAVGICPANVKDCFAGRNVMSIVIQLDKTLVTTDMRKLLSIWASTHAAP